MDYRQIWAEIRSMYEDEGALAGKIRGEHLSTVVRLTPYAMAANIGSASLMLWALQDLHSIGLYVWYTLMLATACAAMQRWRHYAHRSVQTASRRAVGKATWHAGVLALLWACLPVFWFATVTSGQQLLIATLFTGMLGAGTFLLSPLPRASLTYASIFTAAALWALWDAGAPVMAGVAGLMIFYAPINMAGAVSSWRKATALIISRSEAVRQEQLLSTLFQDFEQSTHEALWEIRTNGLLAQASPRLCALLRLPAAHAPTTSLPEWLEQHAVLDHDAFSRVLDQQVPFHSLPMALEIHGERFHLAFTGKPFKDEWGHIRGWRGVVADKTSIVQAHEQLERLAHTDSLTGLANRFFMHQAIAEEMKAGRGGALLLIDLDYFKTVNDTLGHSVGDAVLQEMARRLQTASAPSHLIARLGGDEFAVLMRQSRSASYPLALAQRQAHLLAEALNRPLNMQGRRLRMGASIGLALFDPGHTDVDGLLVQADTALYAAKDAGRGRYVAYTPEMGERNQRQSRLENDLREAIQRREMSLHWQPQIDISTGRLCGAEGLLRWKHPELGPIAPSEFIQIAEHSGTIDILGAWVLLQACEAAVHEPALAGLDVSVNVSALQLAEADFVTQVQATLLTTGLAPHRLELEITESIFIDDPTHALQQLHALRALGVRIALDDFGTGYSSLSYLSQFPFHTLKIDRAFLQKAGEHGCGRTIVKSIVQMASDLGMRTVAEGVEAPEQLALLCEMGATQAQGYLWSRPCSADAFAVLRSKWDQGTAEERVPLCSEAP